VTLLEKNEQLGGRASRLEADGFRFDMGPSWYLMPDVFERFFGHFGREPSEFYELERLDPHYRVFWKDGDKVDVLPDREANKALFEEYEPGAGEAFEAYLEESERTYEIGMEHFVYEDRPRLRDYVDKDVLRYSWGLASRQDAGTRRGLLRPPEAPAADAVHPRLPRWLPDEHPRAVQPDEPRRLQHGRLLPRRRDRRRRRRHRRTRRGPRRRVRHRRRGDGHRGTPRGFALDTADGERYLTDLVVSDADYAHTEQELLPKHKRQYSDEYWESRTYAPSAFLLYLGVEGDVPNLEHHTLVLPTGWNHHFEQIFDDPAWPDDPAYYLCAPSETDDTVAPEGHSNLFALVPIAPGLEDTPELREEYRDLVLDDIAENTDTGAARPDRLRGDVLRRRLRGPVQQLPGKRARAGTHPATDFAASPAPPVRRARRRALLHGVDDDPVSVSRCVSSADS